MGRLTVGVLMCKRVHSNESCTCYKLRISVHETTRNLALKMKNRLKQSVVHFLYLT